MGARLRPRTGSCCPIWLVPSEGESCATSWRSAPAQKVPWAPCNMQTFCVGSFSKARNASRSFLAVGGLTAFRLCWRLIVMVVMPWDVVLILMASGSSSASSMLFCSFPIPIRVLLCNLKFLHETRHGNTPSHYQQPPSVSQCSDAHRFNVSPSNNLHCLLEHDLFEQRASDISQFSLNYGMRRGSRGRLRTSASKEARP